MSERAGNPYETGLDKNAANYVPLTPIGFLRRSASVYPDRLAVAYGARRYSWREALERWVRLPPVPHERWERLDFPTGFAFIHHLTRFKYIGLSNFRMGRFRRRKKIIHGCFSVRLVTRINFFKLRHLLENIIAWICRIIDTLKIVVQQGFLFSVFVEVIHINPYQFF